jgi:dipeptidyl-peptidase-3
VLRYQIQDGKILLLKSTSLLPYQAGTSGRDIMWDQHYKYNLKIRTALEHIYQNYNGDKRLEIGFEIYLKRVWFSNGIHHHYSSDKIKPDFQSILRL